MGAEWTVWVCAPGPLGQGLEQALQLMMQGCQQQRSDCDCATMIS